MTNALHVSSPLALAPQHRRPYRQHAPGLSPDDPYRTGTQIDVSKARQRLTITLLLFLSSRSSGSKDIPSEGRVLVCTPEVFYSLIQSSSGREL